MNRKTNEEDARSFKLSRDSTQADPVPDLTRSGSYHLVGKNGGYQVVNSLTVYVYRYTTMEYFKFKQFNS